MSTSRHIDVICVVVLLCTLLVTGLFMNGEALGIKVMASGDTEDGQFTANDRNADWDTGSATMITLNGDTANIQGNGAYVLGGDVYIVYAGKYVISGELTDGSIIVDADGDDKIWMLLNGVSIHREDSAAILVEQADKVFLTLAAGTENTLSGGAEYSGEAVSSGIDGVIYSRDDLTVNGGGALTVNAAYQHGIVCNDDFVLIGGNISITAAQDGIHANDSARFAEATITINAGDDGITVSNDDETAYAYVESGNISIPNCYEGIEAINVTIAGGVLDIRPTDDGINANGSGGNSAIYITGGDISIINESGRDADGLDSNGSIYISGGNIFISVSAGGGNAALDCGTENGGTAEISGGTIIAAGSSQMAEGFDASSTQCFIMYNGASAPAGTTVTLKNAAGTTLVSGEIPCSYSSVVISTPELQMGETCTLSLGDTETEITVDNSSAASGFGGGMQKGGMFGAGSKPERPAGEQAGTEGTDRRQGMPSSPDGEMPQMSGRGFKGGETSGEAPNAQGDEAVPPHFGSQETLPDGTQAPAPGSERGDRFAHQGQAEVNAAPETSESAPKALIWAGASLLILLAGILIALKVKH